MENEAARRKAGRNSAAFIQVIEWKTDCSRQKCFSISSFELTEPYNRVNRSMIQEAIIYAYYESEASERPRNRSNNRRFAHASYQPE